MTDSGAATGLDVGAIAQMYATHAKRLQAFLSRRMKNPEDAAEVMQESFEKALRHRHGFRGEAKPETWLFSIATMAMFSRHKKSKNDRVTDSIDEVDMPDGEEEDVAYVVDRNRQLEHIAIAFRTLPADLQEAMQLVAEDGLPYEEAAEAVGVAVGTMKSRVFRAREKLKTGMHRANLKINTGVNMGAYTKRILELIVRRPGIRTVEIADLVDCDVDLVQPSIQDAIDTGKIVVHGVTAPNGKPANAFVPSPELCLEYPVRREPITAEASEPAGPLKPPMSKTDAAVEYIRNAKFDVVDDDLRKVMGLTIKQYPSAWLSGAIADGKVVRDGKTWKPGHGKPTAAPHGSPVKTVALPPVEVPQAAAKQPAVPDDPAPAQLQEQAAGEVDVRQPVKTKADRALDFIQEHGPATSEQLHDLLDIPSKQHVSTYLNGAVNQGRIHYDGRFWRAGRRSDPSAASSSAENTPETPTAPADPPAFLTKDAPEEAPNAAAPSASGRPDAAKSELRLIAGKMVEEPTFTLEFGGVKFPWMRVIGEWNGMQELRDSQGRALIIMADDVGLFAKAFDNLLGPSPKDAFLVKGHPDLIAKLRAAIDVPRKAAA